MKHKWIPLLLVVVLFIAGCGTAPAAQEESATEVTTEVALEQQEFTLEQLSKYNGKDGARAYVAVDGTVYDVTDSPRWADGQHNGFEAGNDLTDAIHNESPHGVGNLEGIPVVGTLVD